jgi:type VI secretion system protein ImpK
MTISTFLNRHSASTRVAAEPSSTASKGIRELLRDSALLVTTLSTGGKAEDYISLRKRCEDLVQTFTNVLDERGFSRDVRDDAVVAQCALLDETALRHLDDDKKLKWITEPLQVEKLKHHNAGEYVFERLDARMREPSPDVGLLECYAAVLGLGFRGRYALESEGSREALVKRLNALIDRLRPAQPDTLLIEHDGRRLSSWLHRLSPWAIAGMALVLASAVWLAWHVALDAQLASILPKAVKP